MLYYALSVRETLRELGTSDRGLPSSEATERLRIHGANTITVHSEPFWLKIIAPFASIFMAVLFIAAVISFVTNATLDAIMILVIMASSAVIYYVQRFTTDHILRALKKHQTQFVTTLRDGVAKSVEAAQLTIGDVILLHEGEKAPADARIISTRSLLVNESQLTGESLPIAKQSDALKGEKEVYDQTNMLFEGSFIVGGDVTAVITEVGDETEFGHIARLASGIDMTSPVQQKIDQLITWVISVVVAIAVISLTLALLRGMNVASSLELVVALSVSAIPESLPVAISVILVLGMRRIARKKALIRTMRSIETIGAITAIATDKTGTLTKNELSVAELWHPLHSTSHLHTAIAHSVNRREQQFTDPLDETLADFLHQQHTALPTHSALLSLPFDQKEAMSGNLWHSGDHYELYVKGTPEHIIARCDLTESEHEQATAKLHSLTASGYRVVALAHTHLKKPISHFSDVPHKERLTFDGFAAVSDIIRPEAKVAITAAHRAGIAVYMVTGDHYETAFHIGRELGIVTSRTQVLDARHMTVMTDAEIDAKIDGIRIFSRVTPEHKYRILSILKQRHITAMTGDGVNDVPALTDAHVGIAMGSGAHIAKDAGDIILLNDNFKTIIDTVHEGRTILSNIRRMLIYLLATNTGEVLTTIGALLLAVPIPLLPIQILWINLVTDSLLVIPLGLEPGERRSMLRRPQPVDAPLINSHQIARIILIAVTMAALTLTLYLYYASYYSTDYARTVAFSSLVVMQWASAFALRSGDELAHTYLRVHNKNFYASLAVAVTLQVVVLFGPLGPALHMARVAPIDYLITSIIAFIVPFALIELHKHASLHHTRHKRRHQMLRAKNATLQ